MSDADRPPGAADRVGRRSPPTSTADRGRPPPARRLPRDGRRRSTPTSLDHAEARRETGPARPRPRPARRRRRRAGVGLLPAPQALPRRVHRRRAGRPAVRRADARSPGRRPAPRDDRPPAVAAEEGRSCTALLRLQRRIDAVVVYASTAAAVRHRAARLPARAGRSCSPFMVDTGVLAARRRRRAAPRDRADDLRRRPGAARLPDAGRGRARPRRRRRHRRRQPVVEARRQLGRHRRPGERRRSAGSTCSTCASCTPTPRSSSCRSRRPTSRPASRRSSRRCRWAGPSCARGRRARPTRSSTARPAVYVPPGDVGALRGGDRAAARRPRAAGAARRGGPAWVVEHADIDAYAADLAATRAVRRRLSRRQRWTYSRRSAVDAELERLPAAPAEAPCRY